MYTIFCDISFKLFHLFMSDYIKYSLYAHTVVIITSSGWVGVLRCFSLSGNDKKTFKMFQMIIKNFIGLKVGWGGYIILIQELRPYTSKPNAWIKGKSNAINWLIFRTKDNDIRSVLIQSLLKFYSMIVLPITMLVSYFLFWCLMHKNKLRDPCLQINNYYT